MKNRFELITDKIMVDHSTNLMWEVNPKKKQMNWQDAVDYCTSLDVDDFSDWRLPTINELISLLDYTQFYPAITKNNPIGVVSSNYWSSTTTASNTYRAWLVDFGNGNVSSGYKSNSYYVRSVRSLT